MSRPIYSSGSAGLADRLCMAMSLDYIQEEAPIAPSACAGYSQVLIAYRKLNLGSD